MGKPMGVSKYTAKFKDEAIRQVTTKGRSVGDVAQVYLLLTV